MLDAEPEEGENAAPGGNLGRPAPGRCRDGDPSLAPVGFEGVLLHAPQGFDADKRVVVAAEGVGQVVAQHEFARRTGAGVIDGHYGVGAVGRGRRDRPRHRLASHPIRGNGDFARDQIGQRVVASTRRRPCPRGRLAAGRRERVGAEGEAVPDSSAVQAHRGIAHRPGDVPLRRPEQ